MISLRWWPRIYKSPIFALLFLLISLITFLNWLAPGRFDYGQIKSTGHCDNHVVHDQRYLLFPMVTISESGGIGNRLFEVFSLLGLAKTLNRTAIFNADDTWLEPNLALLRMQFPQIFKQISSISIEVLEAVRYPISPACCAYQLNPLLFCEQSKFLYLEGYYFQSYKYFANIESDVKNWLKPVEIKRQKVENIGDNSRFKTCVHTRRGDFLTDGQHAGTDARFTIRAIEHLETLHPGIVYVFGDDPQWAREEIADFLDSKRDIRVVETPRDEAMRDLYFSLAHCDAVLITAPSSTFGWWMGYLAKNQSKVYYRDIRDTSDKVQYQMIEKDFFPDQWKKLGENGRFSTLYS